MNLAANFRLARGYFSLDVEFELTSAITALFGPSGSGKTTLLHTLAGLHRPANGRIELGSEVLFDADSRINLRPSRRRVGMVFQDLRLFPHLSVARNLRYGYDLQPASERRLSPPDVIEMLELDYHLEKLPDELSGGERQRVALGRTLLATPRLLLMDEPLAALDTRLRRQILPYLRWVHERLEIPIVYVSHSLAEILDLTDRVLVLDKGQITGHGEVFDVLGETLPGDRESFHTTSLLDVKIDALADNGDFVRGRIGDQEVMLPYADVRPATTGRVGVRPEDVMLAQHRLTGISARNQIEGEVVRISPLHGRLLIHLRVGEATIRAELTESARRDLGVEVGATFYCVVKTSAFEWSDEKTGS